MNEKLCPICQAPIPPNAPGGFCPACLLRDAEESAPTGHGAPSVEEIAAAFPQLEILELIGQGGMGFVYKARQPGLDRVVALKILSPELGRDPAFAERFAREARVLGKLHHPNIVTVFEHGERDGFFYLVMEFVDGVNLRQAMRAGRFTPEQALAIVPGVCDALQFAHEQGVWHRDIKPENILLDARGAVKMADFGIARIVGDPRRDFTLTLTGNALGSAAYMAPEQHENPRGVDHRADIYSLGVVIYEMLTGELPLGRFPLPSQRAEVNARIDEIVLKTLEKERDLRQQSATEVKTQVQGAGMGDAVSERDVKTPVKRSNSRAVRVAAALMIGIALAWGGFQFSRFQKTIIPNDEEREVQRLEQLARSSPDLLRQKRLIIDTAEKGWARPMEFLLKQANSPEADQLALVLGANEGHLAIVQVVLSRGVDPKGEAMADALNKAAEKDYLTIAKALLGAGASPDGKAGTEPPKFSTPLLAAIRHQHLEIARLLIDKGADVNLMPMQCAPDLGPQPSLFIGSPLHEAVRMNTAPFIELLLGNKADVNLASPQSQITPLWLAAWHFDAGNPSLVKRLLEAGGDPDATSAGEPNSLFHYPGESSVLNGILRRGSVESVEWILKAKKERGTPVKPSILRDVFLYNLPDPASSLAKTRLLLDHGASPNPPDGMYEMLLKHWRNGVITEPREKSLLEQIAKENNATDPEKIWPIIELLLERGAEIDPKWRTYGFTGAHPVIVERLRSRFPNPLSTIERRPIHGKTYSALIAHIQEKPVFMIVVNGSWDTYGFTSGVPEFGGSLGMGERDIDYLMDDETKVTINDHTYELARGRVFLIRLDGTLRQVQKHLDRMVTKEELDQFVAELPSEK